ncbi:MAG: hypothetical protein JWR83_3178 [Aeromicrobium sp.]|nr:hypothetical protein [Aeromicrobium sp.]
MTPSTFPDGAYLSVVGMVRLGAGGQTRLLLLRHRLFAQYTDHELPILTFNPLASYAPIRAGLQDQGLLLQQSKLINMHEDLRERSLDDLESVQVPEWTSSGSVDDIHDGYVWRRRHTGADATPSHYDYFRTDGSLYARTRPTGTVGPAAIFDHDGRPVAGWPTIAGLRRWWTATMIPTDGRVFLLSDSRFIAEELSPLVDDRVFLLHQMHNPHLAGPRSWSSPVKETYRSSMEHLGQFDALISLSSRQRDDIARSYGPTTNLFVIPNPVEVPPIPDPQPPRRPHAIVMITRLARQKRLDRAIEALALVIAEWPDATLDIYGNGELRESLQHQIDEAGLSGAITLHGYDPHADEALWQASAFWLTSEYEGYPLSTLEAMSRGCPVVSFDVKYGPREQIDDGIDGYLIARGEVTSLAKQTVALMRDEAHAKSMGKAARAKAESHDHRRFLTDWASVLNQVVELKADRTTVRSASWNIDLSNPRGARIEIRGTLTLDVGDTTRLDDLTMHLNAYSPDRDDVVGLPLEVKRVGAEFAFAARIDRQAVATVTPKARMLQLRLGYVWHNTAGHIEVLPAPRRSLRGHVGAALRRLGLRH